jgi:hypothetical protein
MTKKPAKKPKARTAKGPKHDETTWRELPDYNLASTENPALPIEEPESCATCFAWRDSRCKRFPPAKAPGQQFATHRDFTEATDWCGEYRRA